MKQFETILKEKLNVILKKYEKLNLTESVVYSQLRKKKFG